MTGVSIVLLHAGEGISIVPFPSFAIIGIVLMAVFAIGLGLWAASQVRTHKKLREQGIATYAQIMYRRSYPIRWEWQRHYFVTYRYYHNGWPYTREQQVSSSNYNAWYVGAQVPLRYLPDHPTTARLEGENTVLTGAIIGSVFTATILLAFFLFFVVAGR